MRLKSLLLILSIAMALVLGACGSSDSKSSDSKGKVVLDYWHTYSDAEEEALVEKIKPLFEESHPDIELKLTRMPYEGLKQQVIAGVSGGEAPDLMRMDIIWVPEFAKMGALQELDAFNDFDDVKNSVFDATMSTNYFEGAYYGLPLNTNTKIPIYNKEVLESTGITEIPTTIEELKTLATKAVDAGAKGGIAIGGSNAWSFLPYFWSLGGTLTDEEFTTFDGYINSPESIAALEEIVQWYNDGILAPTVLGGEPGTWDGMKNNEYLMIDDGPWFYSLLSEEDSNFSPDEDSISGLMPEGPGGSWSVIGGENLVIFTGSKHPEEAWTFAKWMLTEEPQKIMAEVGMIPTNIEAANAPEVLEVPFIENYVIQLENALPRTPIPQWAEVEDALNLNFEKVIRGEMDAKEALNEVAAKAEELLQE